MQSDVRQQAMVAPASKILRRRVDGIVLLDKPLGYSSNAALQAVKRLFRAAKAGHTGSLDPLATGLLPLCFGEATKLSQYLLDADKSYRARAKFGVGTTTGDAEGVANRHSDASRLKRRDIESAVAGLLGTRPQVPPMYSALKRDGRPLYELARAGVEVERTARLITIHDLRVLAYADGELEFEVRCSKGTYVRTLAEEWAAALSQVAHLTALRRTGLGPYGEADLVTLEQLESAAAASEGALEHYLRPLASAVAGWARVDVNVAQADALAHGQPVVLSASCQPGLVAVFGPESELIGLGQADGCGKLAPQRWFVPTAGPRSC